MKKKPTRKIMIFNITKQQCLARKPFYAVSSWDRLRGMIGRHFEDVDFDAMVFEHCNMIHSCFMTTALDVIFVRRDNIVCDIHCNLQPWRLAVKSWKAYFTIELPAGTIASTMTAPGDVVDLQAELSSEIYEKLKKEKFAGTATAVVPMHLKRDRNETILS